MPPHKTHYPSRQKWVSGISTGLGFRNALWETGVVKKSAKPRGIWQAIGMQEARLEKGSPEKLRIRARHLQGQAESLFNQAEELLAKAREIEAAQEKSGK
jgi:hypothetical protein